jgi:hypothetical protein
MKFRTMFLFWFAVLVGLGIAIGYRSITRPYSFEGTNYDPPKQITDFTLVDYAGQPYRLSDQKGKVVLLFLATQTALTSVQLPWRNSGKFVKAWVNVLNGWSLFL